MDWHSRCLYMGKFSNILASTTGLLAIGFLSFVGGQTLGKLGVKAYTLAFPHTNTEIGAEFKQAERELTQRHRLEEARFTQDTGWSCYSGKAYPSQIPKEYAENAQSTLPVELLNLLDPSTHLALCFGSGESFDKRFEDTTEWTYEQELKTVFVRTGPKLTKLEKAGYTKAKGWDCFNGSDIETHMPKQFAELMTTPMGTQTLNTLQGPDTKICVAPDAVYNKRFPGSRAHYSNYYHGVFFKTSSLVPRIIAHEAKHSEQYAQTNGFIPDIDDSDKLTQAMQTSLLLEAGAVSHEVLMAFQQKANGDSALYRQFYDEGPNGPRGSLVRVLDNLIKKTDAKDYFKNPVGPPPAFVIDTLCAGFLVGSKLPDGHSQSGMLSWLLLYTGSYMSLHGDKDPSLLNFDAATFDNKLVLGLTGNADLPEGTEFPQTQQAINRLGGQIAPFFKDAFTNQKSSDAIRESVIALGKTLQQQPQRYQTAQQAGKGSTRPDATPKATL